MNSKSKANISKAAARKISARVHSPALRTYAQRLLVELCGIDTTPKPEPAQMRDAEAQCFQIIERELSTLPFERARWERRPINPVIQNHPRYSQLHFGLPAEEAYAGRSNLIYIAPGKGSNAAGNSVTLNAHVDVVAPYFPPRLRQGVVFGRGACDDKGPLVAVIIALKVLCELMTEARLKWNRNVVATFVIDEETGGNGSLALALDRDLKQHYDCVLVSEPTSLKIHPANRGAVWYRAELKPSADVSALEMSAFVIEELEKEGAAIRAESRHHLFPQRPVQTCHGMIGPFGEHPSRICGEVTFKIQFAKRPAKAAEILVRDCLESGLADYIGLYGDKTKVTDSTTGKPMVARHYDLIRHGKGFEVTVHGAAGHMGAIRERDGAITKAAHLIRCLVFSKEKLSAISGAVSCQLVGQANNRPLVLEGGQGFVPTHNIEEITERLRQAAIRGAQNYLYRCGWNESNAQAASVTFEKLHNTAFDGDSDSPAMRHAIATAKEFKIWKDEPITGWTASCDARLFATEYPGMPVLTFGPGNLAFAHSDQEQIAIKDIMSAVEFLALFLLRQTGTLSG